MAGGAEPRHALYSMRRSPVWIFSYPSWAGPGTLISALATQDEGDSIALLDVRKPDEGKILQVLWHRSPDLDVTPRWPVYRPDTGRCFFAAWIAISERCSQSSAENRPECDRSSLRDTTILSEVCLSRQTADISSSVQIDPTEGNPLFPPARHRRCLPIARIRRRASATPTASRVRLHSPLRQTGAASPLFSFGRHTGSDAKRPSASARSIKPPSMVRISHAMHVVSPRG